jgi:DNA repair ATPase RecN
MLLFLREIGKTFLENYDIKKLVEKALSIVREDEDIIKKKLNQIENDYNKNQTILSHLYEDRLNEVISFKQYSLMAKKYEKIINDLEKQQDELNKKLNELNLNQDDDINQCKELIDKFMKFEIPTHELMYQFIEKIEIDKNKNIEVFFKVDIQKYIVTEMLQV